MGSMKDLLGDTPYEHVISTKRQPDLFNHAEQLKRSREARDEGMSRGADAANAAWKTFMLATVKQAALSKERFTADDVFDIVAATPNPPVTHDKRAFGHVMRQAARSGFCKKADCAAVQSRRRTLHASPIQVWDSLIYPRQPS